MLPDNITVVLVPMGRTRLYVSRRDPSPETFPPWVDHNPVTLPPSFPQFRTDAIELQPFSDGARVVHAALHRDRLYVSTDTRHADLLPVYNRLVALHASGGPTSRDREVGPCPLVTTEEPAPQRNSVESLSGEPMYWCYFCHDWYRLSVDGRPSCGCGHRKLVYRYQT